MGNRYPMMGWYTGTRTPEAEKQTVDSFGLNAVLKKATELKTTDILQIYNALCHDEINKLKNQND